MSRRQSCKPRLSWNPRTQMWMVQKDTEGNQLQDWLMKHIQPLANALNRLNDLPARKA